MPFNSHEFLRAKPQGQFDIMASKSQPSVTKESYKEKTVKILKVNDRDEEDCYEIDPNEDDCYEINPNEDDCYMIDPAEFIQKLTFNDSDDFALTAEKGPVALRDFSHPRHLCGKFPFNSTSHESYCSKCFCLVCQKPAPCLQWKGTDGHCNVSKK